MGFPIDALRMRNATAPPVPFGLADFALVSRGTAAFSSTSGDPVAWTTEVYDDSGMVDLGSSASRITIQHSGLYRVMAGIPCAAAQVFRISKNGANFDGFASGMSSSIARDWVALNTGIISASAGDYFQLHKDDTDTTAPADGAWFAIEKLDAATKYCLVKKTATQSIAANTTTALTWNNAGEVADVGGWFDSATSTTQFTVPSGVTRVRITASIELPSSSAAPVFWITNGTGSTLRGLPVQGENFTGAKYLQVASAVMSVAAGDKFRVQMQSSATTIPISSQVWLCIEEVPDYARMLLYRSTSQVVGAAAKFVFDTALYDTASAFNPTNGTIVVPSGYTKMRTAFSIAGSTSKDIAGFVCKSSPGTVVPGNPIESSNVFQGWVSSIGEWITVAAGEEYQLTAVSANSSTVAAGNNTWLCAEFRP
jgi:hypothetical protein